MSYRAHKIVDRLFQGGYPPEGEHLKQAGIDVLVLCAAGYQDADAFPGLEVILAPGDDDPRPHRFARFVDRWHEAGLEAAEHVRAGRNVLVTCYAGQNRSGIVTAFAVRSLTGMKGEDIVDHIQKSRPLALNNKTFVEHIIDTFPEKA